MRGAGRQFRSVLGALAIVAWAGSAGAAPIGPITPAGGHWTVGFDGGIGVGGDLEYDPPLAGITSEIDQNYLYLFRAGYGFNDNFEAMGWLGGGTLQEVDAGGGAAAAVDLGGAFVGGIGAQGVVPDLFGDWGLGAHVSYLWHGNRDSVNAAVAAGGFAVGVADIPADINVGELQGAITLQGDYDSWDPYVGLTLSEILIEGSIAGIPFRDLRLKNTAGVVVGTGFDFSETFGGYIEGRLVDQDAVNFGFLWAF